MSRKLLVPDRMVPLAADPASGVAGDTYWNTTSNKARTHNGTAWQDTNPVGAAGTTPFATLMKFGLCS